MICKHKHINSAKKRCKHKGKGTVMDFYIPKIEAKILSSFVTNEAKKVKSEWTPVMSKDLEIYS